jgi:NTP pyrophosphatase (non-canonical NTP hydrolase)
MTVENVSLRSLQDYIKTKDFKPKKKHAYMLKLMEELGELAEAIRKDKRMADDQIKGTIDEELYDVLYYTVALANLYDVDLEKAFRLKEELNKKKYNLSKK